MSTHVRPILTEKALVLASKGQFSFWVPNNLSKHKIKEEIARVYSVEVLDVNTGNYKETSRTNIRRQKITNSAQKRAVVKLKAGQKIDVFSEVEEK